MPGIRVLLFAVCGVAISGLAYGSVGTSSARSIGSSSPNANLPAFRGSGALAFVESGRLYVLDGSSGTLHQLTHGGRSASPLWSHDGRWLSWQQGTGQSTVWMAHRDGAGKRHIPGGGVRWSPTRTVLATIPDAGAHPVGGLWISRHGAAPRRVARRELVRSFLWSPAGTSIEFVGQSISPTFGLRQAYLYSVDLPAGTVRRLVALPSSAHNGIELAAFWPDGKGVLYWLDPDFSSSIAADGMKLFSLDLTTRKIRTLALTLGYGDWIVPGPAGRRLVIVAGGSRSSYYGKQVALCNESTTTCNPIVAGPSIVTEDPAWSPSGHGLAFVQAKALPNALGFNTRAGYGRWIHSRTLWTARPDSSHLRWIRQAGNGVYDPQWSRDGQKLLFVRDNAVWLAAHAGAAKPIKLIQLFPGSAVPAYPGPYWDITYYGHLQWGSLFAWYRGG